MKELNAQRDTVAEKQDAAEKARRDAFAQENFKFSNIRVKDCPVLVDGVSVHPNKPLDGFSLINVTGTCAKGISLANVKNARIEGIKVTGYSGPLIGINKVTGKGLAGAATIDSPKVPEPVPAPAQPCQVR